MIDATVKHLKKGGVVVFPTDTVYGIGCILDNEKSIQRIYTLRGDVQTKGSLILVSSLTQARQYGHFDRRGILLAKKFWPGPITLLVKARKNVPGIIQGEEETVGIRVPKQPPLITIIQKLGSPIIAPSANFHGKKEPTTFSEIDKRLLALVDYAVPFDNLEKGLELGGKASTLIDLTRRPAKILRDGPISKESVRKILEETEQ